VNKKKYFVETKGGASMMIRVFLILLFIFAVAFFLWSLMRYNEIMDQKKENEVRIEQMEEDNARLRYLVEAPLDDAYKIRIAREKLGMCFPDEIVFYTEMD
jgi:cell division protein FtsB